MNKERDLCVSCMTKTLTAKQAFPHIQQFMTGLCNECGALRAICSTKYIKDVDVTVINWIGTADCATANQFGIVLSFEKIKIKNEQGKEVFRWRWVAGDKSGVEMKKPIAIRELTKEYNKLILEAK